MTDIRALSITEIDTVSGGIDCQTAKVVSSIHELTAVALGACGDQTGAAFFDGMSLGVPIGAGCGPKSA